jgi:hypothetical protein
VGHLLNTKIVLLTMLMTWKMKKDWEILIDGIVSKTKECNPLVKIMSSASQVPTRAFKNNKEVS